jgi:hypothetical protein
MPSPDDVPGPDDPTLRGAATTAVDAHRNGSGTGARTGNGHRPPSDRPAVDLLRRPPGPSTRPALIVVGLTLLLFILGVALELASGSQGRPTPSPSRIATARGAVLQAVPARPLLQAIVSGGAPPDDLLNALAVPRGATPVPTSAVDRGVELYDRSLGFEVAATQQDVISFFRAQLPAEHWQQLSQGPTGNGTQYLILEQHPASDGHEWDLGVTVAPTAFGPQSAVSAPGSGTTSFTLRLYAVSDQD